MVAPLTSAGLPRTPLAPRLQDNPAYASTVQRLRQSGFKDAAIEAQLANVGAVDTVPGTPAAASPDVPQPAAPPAPTSWAGARPGGVDSFAQGVYSSPMGAPAAPPQDEQIDFLSLGQNLASFKNAVWPSGTPAAAGAASSGAGTAAAPGAAVSGGLPSFGAAGVGSGVGGAPGGAAAGGSAAGGGASGAGGLAAALPMAYAYLIGQGKMIENEYPDTWLGRGLLSGLGPSLTQMWEDPKLALFAALGVPFLSGVFRNEKAAEVDPEFAPLWRGAGLPADFKDW